VSAAARMRHSELLGLTEGFDLRFLLG
jgi:hypothetical protein